jgi:hypothetical protein
VASPDCEQTTYHLSESLNDGGLCQISGELPNNCKVPIGFRSTSMLRATEMAKLLKLTAAWQPFSC